jgi:hypothetical protein
MEAPAAPPSRSTLQRRVVSAFFVLLCLLGSVWALYRFVVWPGMNLYPRARFEACIHGRCDKPYVQRVLVPWAVRAGIAVMPEATRAKAAGFVRRLLGADPRLQYGRDYPVEFGLASLLLFASLLGFAFALRRLARVTLGPECWQAWVVPVVALALLPGVYTYMNYVYDLPNLFLFTLGLVLIAEHRRAFFPLFVIAVVNKETAIFLTLVWVLENHRSLPAKALALGVGLQTFLWLVLRGAIGFIYRNNPGDAIEWHLPRNLSTLSKIVSSPFNGTLLSKGREHWPAAVGLVLVVFLLASLRHAPRFLRYALCVAVPIFAMSIFMSLMEELRIYYEVYPTVLLVLASGAGALFRRSVAGSASVRSR